eukprot:761575-Hanusia_phi.AAC.2
MAPAGIGKKRRREERGRGERRKKGREAVMEGIRNRMRQARLRRAKVERAREQGSGGIGRKGSRGEGEMLEVHTGRKGGREVWKVMLRGAATKAEELVADKDGGRIKVRAGEVETSERNLTRCMGMRDEVLKAIRAMRLREMSLLNLGEISCALTTVELKASAATPCLTRGRGLTCASGVGLAATPEGLKVTEVAFLLQPPPARSLQLPRAQRSLCLACLLCSPPWLCLLVPNGAAYRCGKIRVDDIVISINGQFVTSIQEAKVRGVRKACRTLTSSAEPDCRGGGFVHRPLNPTEGGRRDQAEDRPWHRSARSRWGRHLVDAAGRWDWLTRADREPGGGPNSSKRSVRQLVGEGAEAGGLVLGPAAPS